MAIGGAEDKSGDCRILKEFVRLAGGADARVAVVTAATESPDETAAEYIEIFKKCGAKTARHVRAASRAEASKPENIEAIEQATGAFFTGGDQLHITSLIGGTELHQTLMNRYQKDLLVGGTSAGAAVMGNSIIVAGASDSNPRAGAVEMSPGTDLLVGCIIDTHFSQRGRHGRLLTAIAHFPQELGFGIDEDTAMIVERNHFRVFGAGAVTVIDALEMTHTDVPFVRKGQSVALAGVKIHVLSENYKFDFKTRQPVIPERRHSRAAGANENKSARKKPGGKSARR